MNGTMMNFPLTLPHILERAGRLFGKTEVVSKLPGGQIHRCTYADTHRRARQLAEALQRAGLERGERVATLCWNHYRHLECYFGIPCSGGVLHTLNLRLFAKDIAYIAKHAGDKFVIVDDVLLPLLDQFKDEVDFKKIIVIRHDEKPLSAGMLDYEEFLGTATGDFEYPNLGENEALGICYTSGTTGAPKGVVYSHRAIMIHSLVGALQDVNAIGHNDVMLPVVPMFHANAWGLPFIALMVGCKQVFNGPHMDAETLLGLFESEKVTFSGGVPTIWLGILDALEKTPGRWEFAGPIRMACGGSAPPVSMMQGLGKHGLHVMHLWGMTEMSPLGTMSYLKSHLRHISEAERYAYQQKQGLPVPWVEARIMAEKAEAPWDGKTMGELQVRGPFVAGSYLGGADPEKWTADGWFRTGDVATLDEEAYVKLTDRTKDLIKSGGEWISSVDLENALMGHPHVKEAAVVAIAHPKWQERPLAVVVKEPGTEPTPEELKGFLAEKFAKWWLPDAFAFVAEIPHTGTGKMEKKILRDQFKDWKWE